MKVLLVNTFDIGGAAKACIRLHKGLLKNNIKSSILFLHRHTSDVIEHSYLFSTDKKKSLLRSAFERLKPSKDSAYHMKIREQIKSMIPQKLEWFSFPDSRIDITNHPAYRSADIVNLHWVADFVDYSFFKKNKKPVIWTTHDMNPFTGGCHYAGDCRKYLSNCEHCPLLIGCDDDNYSNYVFRQKEKFLRKINSSLNIVSPSKWLKEVSSNSSLLNKFIHQCIPYGIDSSVFISHKKNEARKKLDLPRDKKIILFVSAALHTKRKGYKILKEAIDLLKQDDVLLCSVGVKDENVNNNSQIKEFGHIADENQMSLAYSAADLFIIPSTEDNLPNTVIESLLCGTPVVGFNIGGIPDMIEDGKNGYLAKTADAVSLVECINKGLNNIHIFDRIKIREKAMEKYDLNVQAKTYTDLYKKMLSTKH